MHAPVTEEQLKKKPAFFNFEDDFCYIKFQSENGIHIKLRAIRGKDMKLVKKVVEGIKKRLFDPALIK